MANHRHLHLLLLLLLFPLSSFAEIKTLSLAADARPTILLARFGFAAGGTATLFISSASATSTLSAPDPSLLGFFLLSDASLLAAASSAAASSSSGDDHPDSTNFCVLSSPYIRLLFTFCDLSPPPFSAYNHSFPVTHPDEYGLYFANCAPETSVTADLVIDLYNVRPDGSRDYLSAGEAAVPTVYALFAVAYFIFLAAWLYFTLAPLFFRAGNTAGAAVVRHIHHVMSLLLLSRSLYLLSAAEDQHFLRLTGTPHGWDVAFYGFAFLKGVLLFAVIVLVGAGWSFLRPYLHGREKQVLAIVIPLQIAANVAAAVVGETGPFLRSWVTWNQVLLLVDVACCCAVLFPIVWSIRSLREASKTDGKAARNLSKLTLFRQFYIVVIGYLYFTRIVVYAVKTIANYKYRWVAVAAEEAASLAFYLYMYYTFRPAEKNQYLALDDAEEEAAAVELTKEVEFEL